MFQPKAILVPTDFSAFSEKAFRKALDIARYFAARIHVLHVARPLPLVVGDYWFDEPSVKRIQADIEKASRNEIGSFVGKFPDAKGSRSSRMCRAVYPTADREGCGEKRIDLIVMAARGKTGIKEHLLGGTADRVIRHAAWDVLIVRDRE
jgi:nucleotide-binding universal stress UspA family protein